jgi:hypothetical protein
MKRFFHLFGLCVGLVYSLTAALSAQDTPAVSVDFQVYLMKKPPVVPMSGNDRDLRIPAYVPPELAFLKPDGTTEAMKVSEGRLSPKYHYEGANPLTFVGNSADELRGQVELRPGTRRVLLLLFPGRNAGEPYHILPVETSEEKLRSGQAIVLNLTASPLALELGKDQMLLNSGQSRMVNISRIEDYRLPVRLAAQNQENEWRKRMDEDIILNPASRVLLLLHEPREGQFRILTLENPS